MNGTNCAARAHISPGFPTIMCRLQRRLGAGLYNISEHIVTYGIQESSGIMQGKRVSRWMDGWGCECKCA